MSLRLDRIHARIAPLRTALLEHSIYARINSLESIHVFMQHHVFAVWDFMSLLKTLQRRLCCVNVPWLPPADRAACRLVNEIVLAEESDEDGGGGFASHFDLYRRAMRRCGADTQPIDRVLGALREGKAIRAALAEANAGAAVRRFVEHTFDVIDRGDPCAVAAAFAFGREDLLPDVFQRIVDELNVEATVGLNDFRHYLHRHIELDGGAHGPMAEALIEGLCGTDRSKWRVAEDAAAQALEARISLWDGVSALVECRPGPEARAG
ncbi:MAG: DUF3050 domain-containing protein [Planctomycetales bacterium]